MIKTLINQKLRLIVLQGNKMKIEKLVERRLRYNQHRVWFTSTVREVDQSLVGGKFAHCLYLYFIKSDFPMLKTPEHYSDSIYNFDSFHGGCTFYQETTSSNGEITVKFGCDYQHYGDEKYTHKDLGEKILIEDSPAILKEFLVLVASRK